MDRKLYEQSLVRHFKDNWYLVMFIAEHTESGESMVVYRSLTGKNSGKVWVRPYKMFISEVDRDKYPDVEQRYRFETIDDIKSSNIYSDEYKRKAIEIQKVIDTYGIQDIGVISRKLSVISNGV